MKRFAAVTMRQALADPKLLGSALVGPSWSTWRTFLVASMGEALTAKERETFRQFTGRDREPGQRIEEALFLVGRRGGKDRAAAVLATYLACLTDWRGVLAPGERGVVLCVGADQTQARVQCDYIEGVLTSSPLLAPLIKRRVADSIELKNRISIDVRAANFRRLRGITCVAAVCSEVAFWMDEASANPDSEILAAIRPALATTQGPMILISTPYRQAGELFDIYRKHYGPDGDPRILVVQGSTEAFNPTISKKYIARQFERDPVAAAAEYGADFRNDLVAFISRDVIEGAVVAGRHELSPVNGVYYVAFCDPSGGSQDSMTLAVCHKQGDRVILDCIRECKPPFSPDAVVAEFAGLLRDYRVTTVRGDRYGGEWPRERFKVHGISYDVAEHSKSEIYGALLPILNSDRAELLDHPRLVAQLCGLERRTARGGRDSIDHPPRGHDDVINAAAGALVMALAQQSITWTMAMVQQCAAAPYRRPDMPSWGNHEQYLGERGAAQMRAFGRRFY